MRTSPNLSCSLSRHSRLLRRSATANLEGSLGVGGQNDVGWLLEGEGDERWDQLLAEFPQSGQAMYQSAVFFFGRADYIPGQAMPRDAAERFARGWELYKAALRAEPLNFHYHATLGREVGLLRPRAAAAGVALPADLPQTGAVLEAAAALAVEVEGRGEQQAAEVVETLCNLVIAAFELEDYDVALSIVGARSTRPLRPPRNGRTEPLAWLAQSSGWCWTRRTSRSSTARCWPRSSPARSSARSASSSARSRSPATTRSGEPAAFDRILSARQSSA